MELFTLTKEILKVKIYFFVQQECLLPKSYRIKIPLTQIHAQNQQ